MWWWILIWVLLVVAAAVVLGLVVWGVIRQGIALGRQLVVSGETVSRETAALRGVGERYRPEPSVLVDPEAAPGPRTRAPRRGGRPHRRRR